MAGDGATATASVAGFLVTAFRGARLRATPSLAADFFGRFSPLVAFPAETPALRGVFVPVAGAFAAGDRPAFLAAAFLAPDVRAADLLAAVVFSAAVVLPTAAASAAGVRFVMSSLSAARVL